MLKKLAWSIARPALVAWLKNRALRLPVAKQVELAKRLGVPIEVVGAINDEAVDYVIAVIAGVRL